MSLHKQGVYIDIPVTHGTIRLASVRLALQPGPIPTIAVVTAARVRQMTPRADRHTPELSSWHLGTLAFNKEHVEPSELQGSSNS